MKKATPSLVYRIFRNEPYEKTCEQMRDFTLSRNNDTEDDSQETLRQVTHYVVTRSNDTMYYPYRSN